MTTISTVVALAALLHFAAAQPPVSGPGSWRTLGVTGSPTARHEGCAVVVAGSLYVIGGRGVKPVDVLNLSTNTWTQKPGPGFEIHHMQCVAYQGRYIYMPAVWTGGWPREQNYPDTLRYDTVTDTFANEPGLGARARGAGAAVLHDGKLYVAMGNRGGHGGHATTLAEFDVYDPVARTWQALPNAPDARDHTGAAVVGGSLCVGGGRNGGAPDHLERPVLPVNCYNFATGQWRRGANLPEGRGGSATGKTCNGKLVVAGGEGVSNGQLKAFARVDFYDPIGNKFLRPTFLKQARHGSGLGQADCRCGNLYFAVGASGAGDAGELASTEVWSADGVARNCAMYT